MSLFKEGIDPVGRLTEPLNILKDFALRVPMPDLWVDRKGRLIDIALQGENLDTDDPPPHSQWTLTVEQALNLAHQLSTAANKIRNP